MGPSSINVKSGSLYGCFKTAFKYAGGAAVFSLIAMKDMDQIGKILSIFSVSIGKHQFIDGSSFLTGGLTFFAFQAACELTKYGLGAEFSDKRKVITVVLSHLSGVVATVAFAYLTSVPVITALVFAALGVASREIINRIDKHVPAHTFKKELKELTGIEAANADKDGKVKLDIVKGVSWIVASCSTGGLIYKGGVRIVSWLTGFNPFNLGLRSAALSSVFGFGIFLVAGVVFLIAGDFFPELSKKDSTDLRIKLTISAVLGFVVSSYVNPIPALVNAIMLGSSLLAFRATV